MLFLFIFFHLSEIYEHNSVYKMINLLENIKLKPLKRVFKILYENFMKISFVHMTLYHKNILTVFKCYKIMFPIY